MQHLISLSVQTSAFYSATIDADFQTLLFATDFDYLPPLVTLSASESIIHTRW